MIFENVAKAGKKLSSMTTPITVFGEKDEVDVEEGRRLRFSKKSSNPAPATCMRERAMSLSHWPAEYAEQMVRPVCFAVQAFQT